MIRNRKLNRLKNYDYSKEGYYFVTICTKDKIERFGEIKDGAMILNKCGQIVKRYWTGIPQYYENVKLGQFIIMPNHLHGIIVIVGTEQCSVPTPGRRALGEKILFFTQPVNYYRIFRS